MKIGIIIYHKNIYSIYEKRWVDVCLASIRAQTHSDFVVHELCYSDQPEQLWEGSNYEHRPLENHIFAMNHIIDKAFEQGCDVVANTNLDDFFSPVRLERQIKAINDGYALVSCNFSHVDGNDQVIREMLFHDRDIATELFNNHNIISHPGVMMTKGFWDRNKYYVTNQLGYEDMRLWQKAVYNGEKMVILPEILLHYRIHDNQTGRIHPVQ